MIGRPYTVIMDAVAVSAARDLIRLSAPADSALLVTKAWVGQEALDDLNEVGAVQLQRASTDGTGTSATARPMREGDAAFGGTAVVDLSAATTAGVILVRENFNWAAGWVWTPFDMSEGIIVSPSQRLVLRLETAPSASMTMTAGLTFQEIGG